MAKKIYNIIPLLCIHNFFRAEAFWHPSTLFSTKKKKHAVLSVICVQFGNVLLGYDELVGVYRPK